MDIQEYIESGVIQDYCLGVLDAAGMQQVARNAALYPAIQQEIDIYEMSLKNFAAEGHSAKKQAIKNNIFSIINNLEAEENISFDNLPLINKYSNAGNWLRFVKPLLPATLDAPFLVHELPATGDVEQFIFWTYEPIPHETHSDEQETILLLQGNCRCYIGDEVHELAAGDFLSIPLDKPHNVEILNGPVMAVVQRVKVA